MKLPANLKVIEDSAFRGAPIQEIELPEGLESIGWSAFEGSLLKEIIVPKSCKLLGDSFCVSEQLKKAVILSDDVKPKPLSASSIQGEEFLTSLFFSRQVDERVRKKLKIDVYCNETVKNACLSAGMATVSLYLIGTQGIQNRRTIKVRWRL